MGLPVRGERGAAGRAWDGEMRGHGGPHTRYKGWDGVGRGNRVSHHPFAEMDGMRLDEEDATDGKEPKATGKAE